MSIVALIRRFNWVYTNLIGVVDRHILESEFSLTEGYMSQVIAKLSKRKLVERATSEKGLCR